MRKWLTMMAATVLALGSVGIAAAQDYPTHPVTMIVPFPAGGATDTLARYLAEQMRGILGQSIIIENVAGAAGSIGRDAEAARSGQRIRTLSVQVAAINNRSIGAKLGDKAAEQAGRLNRLHRVGGRKIRRVRVAGHVRVTDRVDGNRHGIVRQAVLVQRGRDRG